MSHCYRGWSHFMLNFGCRTVTPNITVIGSPTPAPAPASSSAPASEPATVPPPSSTVPVTAAPSPSFTSPGPTQSVSRTEIGFEPNYLFCMSTVVTIITYFTWQISHQFLQKGLMGLAVHCGREETLHYPCFLRKLAYLSIYLGLIHSLNMIFQYSITIENNDRGLYTWSCHHHINHHLLK